MSQLDLDAAHIEADKFNKIYDDLHVVINLEEITKYNLLCEERFQAYKISFKELYLLADITNYFQRSDFYLKLLSAVILRAHTMILRINSPKLDYIADVLNILEEVRELILGKSTKKSTIDDVRGGSWPAYEA